MAAWVQRRHVDAVTGERVRADDPAAVWDEYETPVWFQGVSEPVWLKIAAADVDETSGTYPSTRDDAELRKQAEKIRADRKAAKKAGRLRPQTKQRVAGVSETYRNAGKGAELFAGENWRMLESVADLDVEDQIRDLLDGLEVRRGRKRKDGTYKFVRMPKTKKGQEILDAFRQSAYAGTIEFLTWLFSQNRGKRWRDVDWSTVEELGEILTDTCKDEAERTGFGQQCVGWEWYPPGAELRPLAERLSELPERAQRGFESREHQERLAELVKKLRKEAKKAEPCLTAETLATIRRRINYLAKLSREPWRIPAATICGEDPTTGHQLCGFPAIEAEALALRDACRVGYDPRWPLMESLSADDALRLGLPVVVGRERGGPEPDEYEGPGPTLEEIEAIPWEPSEENPEGAEPPAPGTLDAAGRRMLWSTYEDAKEHYRKQGERGAELKSLAARVAWAQVGRHYYKRGGKWHRRKRPLKPNPAELDLRQEPLDLENPGPVYIEPNKTAKRNAQRGLNARARAKKSKRGGLTTREAGRAGIGSGVARARDIVAGRRVDAKRVASFFARHRANYEAAKAKGLQPEDSPAIQAWLLWGGDALDRQAARALAGSKSAPPSSKARRVRSRANPAGPWGELLDLRARVMSLEVETPRGVEVHTWHRDRPALFWSEKRRALVWVHGGRDPSNWTDNPATGPIASRHRRWHGEEPTERGSVELPAGPLAKLGPALRIVYSAERYRDGIPRHHDFSAGVAAYAQKGRGARVFEVRGGRLTLTDRGLVY